MPEKQKGGNFLTEILGVYVAKQSCLFVILCIREVFFSNTKNNKKTVCATAPEVAKGHPCRNM